jgi:hypothetical protein
VLEQGKRVTYQCLCLLEQVSDDDLKERFATASAIAI